MAGAPAERQHPLHCCLSRPEEQRHGGEAARRRRLPPWTQARTHARALISPFAVAPAVAQTILPSEAFASLRDGESSSDITVEARRPHFENHIFQPLTKAGAWL